MCVGDSKILLPEESVVCRGPEGVILTSDGWIARIQTHGHKGITQLFRMLHVKDIKSVDAKRSKFRDATRVLLYVSIMVAGASMLLQPFSYGLDIFWDGFHPSQCVGPQNCSGESWLNDYGLWSWIAYIWVPLLFVPYRQTINIVHSSGTMKIQQESLNQAWIFLILSVVWWLVLYPIEEYGASDAISDGTVLILLFIGAMLIWNSTKKELFPHWQEEAEIPDVRLHEFHRNLLIALGLSGEEEGVQEIISLGETMSDDLTEIKQRLEAHDAMLSQIVAHYPDIFGVPAPWLGITGIRASTEILLGHRLRQILPNPSKEIRTLANYRDQLKRHDTEIDNEVLRSIEVIISLGNAATHNMEATKEDYISALQKFAGVVDWHLTTPAKSVAGS